MLRKQRQLGDVAQWWLDHDGERLPTFGGACDAWIDWGEPFCFACGWRAPVPNCLEVAEQRSIPNGDRSAQLAWNGASGWLEVAHLQDHAEGGGEELSNLVPLCALCHCCQPRCRSREEGVAFVHDHEPEHGLPRWVFQSFTDEVFWGVKPGHGSAARKLTRAAVYAQRGWIRVLEHEATAA